VTWTWPTPGLGTLLCLVIFIVAVILAALHQLEIPAALLICAVCAHRL
jgi:hypothetical protein